MPVVAIDLTEEEATRIDAIATDEKRVRKQQTHVLVLIGLEKIESEKNPALNPGMVPVI